MRVAIGSDTKHSLPELVISEVEEMGHQVERFGVLAGQEGNWADVAIAVAEQVRDQKCHEGILMCWNGVGVTVAANKVRSVRAALCRNAETAQQARHWNFANVLALSLNDTDPETAKAILRAWFNTPYGTGDLGLAIARLHEYELAWRTSDG